MVFSRSTPRSLQRSPKEIPWFSWGYPQGPLSENLQESYGVPLICSGSSSRKLEKNPEVFLKSPQRALSENLTKPFASCPSQGTLCENLKKNKKCGFLEVPTGRPSENQRISHGFPEVSAQGALGENLKKFCGFPGVPPGGPLRIPLAILWFSCGQCRGASATP